MENKQKVLVPALEREQIARSVCAWLNSYTDKPVTKIEYEYLGDSGITISAISTPYKLRQFIDGCYVAQYQFFVTYRSRPANNDARLRMDESLDRLAAWAESNIPDFGAAFTVQRVECLNGSTLVNRYDDGSEDHQISLSLTYRGVK